MDLLSCSLGMQLVIACVAAFGLQDTTTIDLGGARKVVVDILEDDETLHLKIQMNAVRSFDQAMNAVVNREKALGYAKVGIWKYRSPNNNKGLLTLHGLEIDSTGSEGVRYYLQAHIPSSGVKIDLNSSDTSKVSSPTQELDRPTPKELDKNVHAWKSKTLLTAKNDLLETCDVLSESFRNQIPEMPKDLDFESANELLSQTTKIEDGVIETFRRFRSEIRDSKLLLSIEMKEVLDHASTSEEQLFDALRKVDLDAIKLVREQQEEILIKEKDAP